MSKARTLAKLSNLNYVPGTGTLTVTAIVGNGAGLTAVPGTVASTADVPGLVTALAAKAPIANPTFTGTVGGITKSMVGLSVVDNTSDADKPLSGAAATALAAKAPVESPVFTGTITVPGIKEPPYVLTGVAFSAANGSLQKKTLTAIPTFTDSLVAGESIALILVNGATYPPVWPTMTWFSAAGNVPPALTNLDLIRIFKLDTGLCGSYGGSGI